MRMTFDKSWVGNAREAGLGEKVIERLRARIEPMPERRPPTS
jgi:hypothetical protein